MAKTKIARKNLGHGYGMAALTVALAAFALPTIASAQDANQRPNGGWQRGDGRGGQVPHNRGDRMAQGQQRPGQPAPGQQAVRQAPPASQQQPPAGRNDRVEGYRENQTYRGAPNGGNDQRGWTDAQRQAYRGAVLEGRATDQFQNHGNDRGNWQTDRQGYRNDAERGGDRPQGDRNDSHRGDRDGWNGRGDRNDWSGRGDRNGWQDNRGGTYGREQWRNNGGSDNRNWDRGWRSNNRYNWSSYRSSNRAIFSSGRYYAPSRGYSYRRLNIGFSLDSVFYGSRYWINDPYYYRLPEAYGPYRWVRYYDDVLLINTYNGEVVDAIYDFFY